MWLNLISVIIEVILFELVSSQFPGGPFLWHSHGGSQAFASGTSFKSSEIGDHGMISSAGGSSAYLPNNNGPRAFNSQPKFEHDPISSFNKPGPILHHHYIDNHGIISNARATSAYFPNNNRLHAFNSQPKFEHHPISSFSNTGPIHHHHYIGNHGIISNARDSSAYLPNWPHIFHPHPKFDQSFSSFSNHGPFLPQHFLSNFPQQPNGFNNGHRAPSFYSDTNFQSSNFNRADFHNNKPASFPNVVLTEHDVNFPELLPHFIHPPWSNPFAMHSLSVHPLINHFKLLTSGDSYPPLPHSGLPPYFKPRTFPNQNINSEFPPQDTPAHQERLLTDSSPSYQLHHEMPNDHPNVPFPKESLERFLFDLKDNSQEHEAATNNKIPRKAASDEIFANVMNEMKSPKKRKELHKTRKKRRRNKKKTHVKHINSNNKGNGRITSETVLNSDADEELNILSEKPVGVFSKPDSKLFSKILTETTNYVISPDVVDIEQNAKTPDSSYSHKGTILFFNKHILNDISAKNEKTNFNKNKHSKKNRRKERNRRKGKNRTKEKNTKHSNKKAFKSRIKNTSKFSKYIQEYSRNKGITKSGKISRDKTIFASIESLARTVADGKVNFFRSEDGNTERILGNRAIANYHSTHQTPTSISSESNAEFSSDTEDGENKATNEFGNETKNAAVMKENSTTTSASPSSTKLSDDHLSNEIDNTAIIKENSTTTSTSSSSKILSDDRLSNKIGNTTITRVNVSTNSSNVSSTEFSDNNWQSNKTDACGKNEDWWHCIPEFHNTCDNFARAEARKDFVCVSGCFCINGLIKTSNGECVEPDHCPDPICKENEEETDCMNPCNTCESNCHKCNFMTCRPGCDCLDGYKRDHNGTCIHASACPPCMTSTTSTTARPK